MTSQERLKTALDHREPDRVPLDLGSTPVTGIVTVAYRNYCRYQGLPYPEPEIQDVKQQLARPHPDFLADLEVDTRPIARGRMGLGQQTFERDGDYEFYYDEWDLGWRRPVPDGLYFDLFDHVLRDYTLDQLKAWKFIDPLADWRYAGMVEEAARLSAEGYGLVLGGVCAGVWEMALWLRGYDQFLFDMAAEPELADWLIGHMVDLKLAYWEKALGLIGDQVTVCNEADDLGAQHALMVSPNMYRTLVKPHQKRLFSGIKALAPHVKLFYHSDGAIYEVLPDLVELGVDILNPVQVNAAGMGDTAKLKREFGDALTFWGAACDSQDVLPHGTPQQVADEVKRRIDDLAPGGGYVFAGVHNIQADVPPENLDAFWTTFREEAGY